MQGSKVPVEQLERGHPSTRAGGRRRDPARARETILLAAIEVFSACGFERAKLTQIVEQAGYSVRMVYHYFGGKEQLYLAALERIYTEVRSKEAELDLKHLPPVDGMKALVTFTYRYLWDHPEFIALMRTENQLQGRFLKKSNRVHRQTMPLVKAIEDLLRRGEDLGQFRPGVDPIQLYVTILSVCFLHLSNRHTLSIIFQMDLRDRAWIEQRLEHVVDVVLGYLQAGSGGAAKK